MLHLCGQDAEGLARALDIDLADARRILGAVVGRERPLRQARNVRRAVLDRAEALASAQGIACQAKVDARDGFRRYLFALADGARVESVRIPLFDTHHTLFARELPGVPVVRRYSGGQDEHAACGMLASRGCG